MKKIVLLSQDQKAALQIKQWARELGAEVAFEHYANFDEWFAPKANGPSPAEDGGAVHVAIVDADDGDPKAVPGLLKAARAKLAAAGCIDSKRPLSFLAMVHESPVDAPAARDPIRALRDSGVDDLILKPLDRSLFLQKAEILMAEDPASAVPSFLFNQKTQLTVEIGKETTIDRVGESAFAIRNPAPLVDGVFARAYCDLFGEGDAGRLYGRSFRNEPHPEHPGEWLAYFSYFGVTHDQLTRVRKFVKAQAGFRARGAAAAGGAAKPGAFRAGAPAKASVNVAVIDVDPFSRAQLAETLESNFLNVRAQQFPSYSSFLAHSLGQSKAAAPPAPAAAAAAPAEDAEKRAPLPRGPEQILFVLDGALDVVEASPPLRDGDALLGIEADVLRDRPAEWLSAFAPDEREMLGEFAAQIAQGRDAGCAAQMTWPDGAEAYLEIKGNREKAGDGEGAARLRLRLKEIDRAAFDRLRPALKKPMGVDAVVIDARTIPDDPEAWREGLAQGLVKAGLLDRAETLVIIAVGEESDAISPARLRTAAIREYVCRPLDRRLIVEKATLALPGALLNADAPHAEFYPCSAPARIAKDAEIEEFSEYGALIKHRDPLRDDAFVAFFGNEFSEKPGEPIWARCAHCEKGGEDGLYRCFFRFFGIGDAALKRIRAWIREDYVAKKEPA